MLYIQYYCIYYCIYYCTVWPRLILDYFPLTSLLSVTNYRIFLPTDYSSLLKHCQAMEPVLAGSLSEYHYIRIRMLEHVMDAAIGKAMNTISAPFQ